MVDTEEYNPLDYDNLTEDCIRKFMDQPAGQMPPSEEFTGSGVYALYYDGDFVPYQSFRSPLSERPIYVGSAVPSGTRKGSATAATGTRGKTLYNRLQDHAESLQSARNLRREDFRCRYLVVVRFWIPIIERFLIDHYQPIWNVVLDGFGKHPPGGRRPGAISWWDAFHPGRTWAERELQSKTAADAEQKLKEWLEDQASGRPRRSSRRRAPPPESESD